MAAGDLVLTAVAQAALLARLDATALQGGSRSTPSQKSLEISDVLHEVVYAVTPDVAPGDAGEIIILTAAKTILLARLKASALQGGTFPSPFQKSMELADILHEVITAVVPDGGAANGNVILTTAARAALLLRMQASALQGGSFSSPHQKSLEIAAVLRALINAVDTTG